MQYRRISAEDQNIPFSNYGITIAKIQGILARSVEVLSWWRYSSKEASGEGPTGSRRELAVP